MTLLPVIATSDALTSGFKNAIASFSPGLPLAVAVSGGADSTALLLACAAKWPGQVVAIHIHHGLQAAGDDFELHCSVLCERLKVPLVVERVNAAHAIGESPEDTARKSRYAALRAVASRPWAQGAIKDIAIAQHADDQVETMLLALSRGAGLPGLAAMPTRWTRDGVVFHRPLLAVPGAQLRRWLGEQQVPWVEDPTNSDERFTRNRIRARLLPPLEAAFPQFRDTFARSARHAAQAQALLNEVAGDDLLGTGCPPQLAALQQLSKARQANLLRYWLRRDLGAGPSEAQLSELLAQIAACNTRGHRIELKIADGHVRLQGQSLCFLAADQAPSAA